jgi:hypothetical protein
MTVVQLSRPDPILDALNPAQRRAVDADDRPLLIVAGAGTGKNADSRA